MCIIIDKNRFGPVFNGETPGHDEFKPILDWITKGNGKIVYGGKTYKKELKQSTKYHKIFRYFLTKGRVVMIPDEEVDLIEEELIPIYKDTHGYNDHHIVAIVIASKCRLVCTRDEGLIDYLKECQHYPNRFKKPLIYKNFSNKNLLTHSYIADVCKPCHKMKKIALGEALTN